MITAFPTRNPYPFIGYLNELPRAKGGSFVSQFGPSALHMIKGIRRAGARASASAERKQAAARAENPFLAAPEGIAILMQGVSKLRCFSFA